MSKRLKDETTEERRERRSRRNIHRKSEKEIREQIALRKGKT